MKIIMNNRTGIIAAAQQIIAHQLANRDGNLWITPRTEMEEAIMNLDLPAGLTIGEFRELYNAALDSELRKFR